MLCLQWVCHPFARQAFDASLVSCKYPYITPELTLTLDIMLEVPANTDDFLPDHPSPKHPFTPPVL